MRLTPMARHHALAVVRHASIAAGLGLGWVLLSGAAASASSDLLGTGGLLGTATSAPVTTVAAPVTSTVSHVTTDTVAPLPDAQLAGSTLIQSTTTAVAQTITTAGNTVGGIVSTPLPLPPPIPAPVSQPATVPASGDQAAPVPAAISEAAPLSNPAAGADSDQAAVPAPPAATDVRPAGDAQTAGSATGAAGGVPVWNWSVPGAATAPQGEIHSAANGSPAGSPDEPWSPPLLDQPTWLSAGNAGSFAGWPTSPATLASALILIPLLLVSFRNRPVRGLLPPSPAFDPGSTPD